VDVRLMTNVGDNGQPANTAPSTTGQSNPSSM
jgi:hypothetical protein